MITSYNKLSNYNTVRFFHSEVGNESVDSLGPVNSPVVSLTVEPLHDNHFESPVVLILKHTTVSIKCNIIKGVYYN